uniref:Incilarin B n=1 Tax=Meghimatium fruhstorferi TaxID=414506 RepID=O02582_MEGFU|nr:Incilarin B [Meghimatium fruhstorferi]
MIRLVLLLALTAHCVNAGCPNAWKEFNGFCYAFNIEKVNWLVAAASCKVYTARLPEIDSSEKNEFLLKEIAKLNSGPSWIGASSRLHHLVWEWVPSLANLNRFSNWQPGEPNDRAPSEHCAVIQNESGKKGWVDVSCFLEKRFICEKKL